MATETKIRGLKVYLDEQERLIIEHAYQITNIQKIYEIIEEAFNRCDEFTIYSSRDMVSLVKEWIGKNRLYKIYVNKNKITKYTFNPKESKLKKVFYSLLGFHKKGRLINE